MCLFCVFPCKHCIVHSQIDVILLLKRWLHSSHRRQQHALHDELEGVAAPAVIAMLLGGGGDGAEQVRGAVVHSEVVVVVIVIVVVHHGRGLSRIGVAIGVDGNSKLFLIVIHFGVGMQLASATIGDGVEFGGGGGGGQ